MVEDMEEGTIPKTVGTGAAMEVIILSINNFLKKVIFL